MFVTGIEELNHLVKGKGVSRISKLICYTLCGSGSRSRKLKRFFLGNLSRAQQKLSAVLLMNLLNIYWALRKKCIELFSFSPSTFLSKVTTFVARRFN